MGARRGHGASTHLVGDLIEFAADDFEHELVWQEAALCDDALRLCADGRTLGDVLAEHVACGESLDVVFLDETGCEGALQQKAMMSGLKCMGSSY